MIYVDELKNMWIYKRKFHLPISKKNKLKGSAIILLTPNIESSINLMKHPLTINRYHNGYFLEKDIMYYINNENRVIIDKEDLDFINEYTVSEEDLYLVENTIDQTKISVNDYTLNNHSLIVNNENNTMMILFNDYEDIDLINEGSIKHNNILKRLFYKERLKRNKELFQIYERIQKEVPQINRTYLNYERYKQFNLFVDFYYYNEVFFRNNMYKLDRGLNLYLDLLTRYLKDKRLEQNGYNMKHIFVPIYDWKAVVGDSRIERYNETINPISIIYRLMLKDLNRLKQELGGIPFIFFGENYYFKVDFSEITKRDIPRFLRFINMTQLVDNDKSEEEINFEVDPENKEMEKKDNLNIKNIPEKRKETVSSIVTNVVDKLEKKSNIKINNLTGTGNTTEDELVKRISTAAITSNDTEEALEKIEDDPEIKRIIADLNSIGDEEVKITSARSKRISKLKEDFMKIKIDNKTVEEIITATKPDEPIPEVSLPVDSINEEWKNMKYMNFEEIYNVEEDLLKIMDDLSSPNKSNPISIRNIRKEDTSTSEDYVVTYTFEMEDANGKRFSVVLDIPEFDDNKFLMLKGNRKAINRQLMLLPVVKTDRDTVQVVTNYNKLILTRFGNRSYVVSDRIIKTLDNMDKTPLLKISVGDCTIANTYFNIPIDYMEIGQNYTKIDTKDYVFMFNQKEIREKYKDIYKDQKDSFPIGYDKINNKILYCKYNEIFSDLLYEYLSSQSEEFVKKYQETNPAKKYTYTRVSILDSEIPLIVVLAYNEGILKVMDKAKIKYNITDKRPNIDKDRQDIIKFKDAYIVYDLDYESSLLMNGLKECNTQDYSITEINSKSMYLDFLDNFGGRIKADGIENFYECLIDPITTEILTVYNLPTDFTELLLYANDLLADTQYTKHTDMNGIRYRSNEIVAACIYKVISSAYGDYRREVKRNRKEAKLSLKRTAVIDELLTLNIVSDVSELSPILEAETLHTVSTKGPSGMNNERAYTLDKRAYDETMINLLGMSTVQGPGVGINRQSTIDMNIEGKRGFIKIDKDKEFSITKTLTVSEALTPFGVTHDDPPRTSMNLSQAKHTMQVKHADPLLISNGIEEAIPFMISNTFAHKAKDDGKILEITDEYIVVEYKDKTTEFIDLRPKILKNSSGGFYISIKLDTDMKVGQKFKKRDILAYDKKSFSNGVGFSDNIAYNSGTLAKIAILNTDDGFEDSAIISERISDKMASDVIIKKEVYLGKNANIFNMVKKGQPVQEGDPLLIYQNSFDEEDVSALLRNLVDNEETVSDLGRVNIKSKYTGVIQDIKIYRTVEKDELSPSLKKKVEEYEKHVKDLKNVMKKYSVEHANRFNEPDYKLDPTGKLKNVRDGVLIEFYIKYEDKMSIGDKLTFFIALKGVVKDIFPAGYEPYTDFRKDEKIDALLSTGSVAARMTCSIKMVMLINKIMIELSRAVKDILKIPYDVNL